MNHGEGHITLAVVTPLKAEVLMKLNIRNLAKFNTRVILVLVAVFLLAMPVQVAYATDPPTIDGLLDPEYDLLVSTAVGDVYVFEDASFFYFTLEVSRSLNENVFQPVPGKPPGWTSTHTFAHLLNSDALGVVLRDSTHNIVYDFVIDYLYDTGSGGVTDPTRWASGVAGPDGSADVGAPSASASSLEWNLENTTFDFTNGGQPQSDWISPPEPAADPWEYKMSYEFKVDKTAFLTNNSNSIEFDYIHNSPSKGEETVRIPPVIIPPVVPPPPPPPTVPGMTEWGILATVAILATSMVLVLRGRRAYQDV